MDAELKLFFEFAQDVATQLIALSTGLLTISITFTKEIFRGIPERGRGLLISAWVLHVLCIAFGVWTLMALTGNVLHYDPDLVDEQLDSARGPAMLQVSAFVVGTVSMLFYGVLALRHPAVRPQPVLEALCVDAHQIEQQLQPRLTDGWELAQVFTVTEGRLIAVLRKAAST